MRFPWCPAGCDRENPHKFYAELCQQYNITQEGRHDAICPVCKRHIVIHTEMLPDYDCSKGENWTDVSAKDESQNQSDGG